MNRVDWAFFVTLILILSGGLLPPLLLKVRSQLRRVAVAVTYFFVVYHAYQIVLLPDYSDASLAPVLLKVIAAFTACVVVWRIAGDDVPLSGEEQHKPGKQQKQRDSGQPPDGSAAAGDPNGRKE